MTDCASLREYLNGELEPASRSSFEDHVSSCADCRKGVDNARRVEVGIKDYLSTLEVPVVTDAKADGLVRAATTAMRGERSFPLRFVAAVAAVTAVAAAITIFVSLKTPDETVPTDQDASQIQIVKSHLATVEEQDAGKYLAVVEPTGSLHALLGKDRFELYEGSRAIISRRGNDEIHIELKCGKITVEAEKRGVKQSLVVSAGNYEVRVVGTVFSVAISHVNEITVGVVEGIVQVTGGSEPPIYVNAGEELVFGRKDTDTATSDVSGQTEESSARTENQVLGRPADGLSSIDAAPFDRTKVLNLINDGKLAEAIELTNKHLASEPRDFQAWMVKADCSVRMNDWESANAAYKKAIRFGDARSANRARFNAAVAAHNRFDRPGRAAELLRDYLKEPNSVKPHEPEALLRLAEAELALGQTEAAIENLDRLLKNHAGSSEAVEARRLRQSLIE